MNILVIGATGLFGSRLCPILAGSGHHVLAMTRSPETAKDLTAFDITGVVGDLDDPETLREHMMLSDRVFIASPIHPELGRREADAIRMAEACGVEQVVKIHGAVRHDDDLLERQHEIAINALRESNLHWTLISPQTVMETNLLAQMESIQYLGQMIGAAGDGRVGMVAAEDCAEAAAVALTCDPPLLDERDLVITGPESLTYEEIAGLLSEVIGRRIQYTDFEEQEFRQLLVDFGMPEEDIELQVLCHFREMRRGHAGLVTDTFEWLTGSRPLSVREWAHEHRRAFIPHEAGRTGH
ncbi:MAG: NAD(P)H-binding protein [Phycisphaerales bacterium]|nr:NAD(P)H-binding protein [Phycisphaerales bacterium]